MQEYIEIVYIALALVSGGLAHYIYTDVKSRMEKKKELKMLMEMYPYVFEGFEETFTEWEGDLGHDVIRREIKALRQEASQAFEETYKILKAIHAVK